MRLNEELYPDGEAWLWGATPGSKSQIDRMEEGDFMLFYRQRSFFSKTEVTLIDIDNESLALDLWKRNPKRDPFLHIFFLEKPEPVEIDYHDL